MLESFRSRTVKDFVPRSTRIFNAKDPGVGELISLIENKFPNTVKHAEFKIYGPGGEALTDFDLVTKTHVNPSKNWNRKGYNPAIKCFSKFN